MDWLRKEREVLIMKYVENLYDWAVRVYDEFCNDNLKIESRFDMTTGITVVFDLRTGKSAFSKCRKDEEFSEEIGVAVAYTRLKGREVPKERKKILVKYLTAGDKFCSVVFPDSVYCVVGVNPLKPTQTIAIHTQTKNLFRFNYYNEVYKIN